MEVYELPTVSLYTKVHTYTTREIQIDTKLSYEKMGSGRRKHMLRKTLYGS